MRAETALATWFAGPVAEARFRRRWLGRSPVVLEARDSTWRRIAPGFEEYAYLARAGLPFQIAADRRYDRSGEARRLGPALAAGKTVFFPQIHQVLPRLARLMAALRAAFLGGGREECSFLFLVNGRGREGLGLHHDGAVDAFWLQLEGRRTLTIGPPVPRGRPEELPDSYAGREDPDAWRTIDLAPGTLFHLPPRTPHRVVCHGRSLAVSLTWKRPARRRGATAEWDVVSGRADRLPPGSRGTVWAQMPAIAGPLEHGGRDFVLRLPDGGRLRLPVAARAAASLLASMPWWNGGGARARRDIGLAVLIERGLVAPRDLPLLILPESPRRLDGWRFA